MMAMGVDHFFSAVRHVVSTSGSIGATTQTVKTVLLAFLRASYAHGLVEIAGNARAGWERIWIFWVGDSFWWGFTALSVRLYVYIIHLGSLGFRITLLDWLYRLS